MEEDKRNVADNITNPLIENMNREGILNKQNTNYVDNWSWCIYCNFDCCFCLLS